MRGGLLLSSRGVVAVGVIGAAGGGCGGGPPPDFAPAPALLDRIESIRIHAPAAACPGQRIEAWYTATLDTGERIEFATRYDDDDPPPLHVIFLERSGLHALPLEDGDWVAEEDPVRSVRNGFSLFVRLRHRPDLTAETTLAPDYGCLPHVFRFAGERGGRAEPGYPGPDVRVGLALLSSPFVERLLVAEVQVEAAPPLYVLADADRVPPADWLVVESEGGPGGRGLPGRKGPEGRTGEVGCPGGPGGRGGPGGDGGVGGMGGRGGRITIIVPEDEPFLAGLVEAVAPGGAGGPGGPGGDGGPGGEGGAGASRRCVSGPAGEPGPAGERGPEGPEGPWGPRARVEVVPQAQVFSAYLPPALESLRTAQQEGQ